MESRLDTNRSWTLGGLEVILRSLFNISNKEIVERGRSFQGKHVHEAL